MPWNRLANIQTSKTLHPGFHCPSRNPRDSPRIVWTLELMTVLAWNKGLMRHFCQMPLLRGHPPIVHFVPPARSWKYLTPMEPCSHKAAATFIYKERRRSTVLGLASSVFLLFCTWTRAISIEYNLYPEHRWEFPPCNMQLRKMSHSLVQGHTADKWQQNFSLGYVDA